MKPVIVSGIKPSGKLQVGNYLGMTKQSVALQSSDEFHCHYFIADYHTLTQKYSVSEKSAEIFNIAVDLLALGIDPEKSIFLRNPMCLNTLILHGFLIVLLPLANSKE